MKHVNKYELQSLEREIDRYLFGKSSNLYKYFKDFNINYVNNKIIITGCFYKCVVDYKILANGKREWLDYKIETI